MGGIPDAGEKKIPVTVKSREDMAHEVGGITKKVIQSADSHYRRKETHQKPLSKLSIPLKREFDKNAGSLL